MTGATVGASFIAGRVISRSSTASDLSEDVSHGTPLDFGSRDEIVQKMTRSVATPPAAAASNLKVVSGTTAGG
jgi:hypothetical protein